MTLVGVGGESLSTPDFKLSCNCQGAASSTETHVGPSETAGVFKGV